MLLSKESIAPTIVSGNEYIYFHEFLRASKEDLCQIGSYPMDYDFLDVDPKYLIGMSVPPIMTAQIAYQIRKQWFKV